MDQYNDDRAALLYKMLIFVCLKFFSFLKLYKYFLIFLYFIWYIISYFFYGYCKNAWCGRFCDVEQTAER